MSDEGAKPPATQAATAAETSPFEPEESFTLPNYKLLEKVGEGGFGEVWVAEQAHPVKRRVAIKVVKLGMDTKAVVARFHAEHQALALMDHPSIAKMFDAGATDTGRPFFVMELVRGIPITQYCDQNNLGTTERVELCITVCQAIQHAHQKGIIHRDIKPSNILVTLHDGKPVPKVIDFGIAKATEGKLTDATIYTQLHQFVGTPAYMSPEQAEMSGLDIDTRSDIYSLGVLLYELLTGRTPFESKELLKSGIDEMRRLIREKEPPRPSTRLATLEQEELTTAARRRSSDAPRLISMLKGDLDWIVMKCLEKDRTRRYETANGLAADLNRHLRHEPVIARPPSTTYRLQKAIRRNKTVFAAGAAVFLALIAGIILASYQATAARHARRLAEDARAGEQAQRIEAQRESDRARTAHEAAERERVRADQERALARRHAYVADMNVVQQSIEIGDFGHARRLLDRHRPAEGEEDLRGFEWRYLWRESRSEALESVAERGSRIASLSLSPDRRFLALGLWGGEIEVWNYPERKLVTTLVTNGYVSRAQFAHRKNLLAYASGNSVELLNMDGRSAARRLPELRWRVSHIKFSPDDELLAYRSSGGVELKVWDISAGKLVHTNISHFEFGSVFSGEFVFSPDGALLWVSGGARTNLSVRAYETLTGEMVREMPVRPDVQISALAASPDGRWVAVGTGYSEHTVLIYDAQTGELAKTLVGHVNWMPALKFSADGKTLYSASSDRSIGIWSVPDWKLKRMLRGHLDELHSICLDPTNGEILTGSKDRTVLRWDTSDAPQEAQVYEFRPEVINAAFLPGQNLMRLVSADRKITLFNPATREETPVDSPANVSSEFRMRFVSANPSYFLQYDGTNRLQLLGFRGTRLEHLWEQTNAVDVVAAEYSDASGTIAWLDRTGELFIADRKSSQPRTFRFERRSAHLVFDRSGRILSNVEALDLRTMSVLPAQFDGRPPLEAWPVSVPLPGILTTRSETFFYNLEELTPLGSVKNFDVNTTSSLSPDGKLLAVASEGGWVNLIHLGERKIIGDLRRHRGGVFGSCFTADGRRLATCSGDKQSVILWDVAAQRDLLELSSSLPLLHAVQISRDGNTILASQAQPFHYHFTARTGRSVIWTAPTWNQIALAEAVHR